MYQQVREFPHHRWLFALATTLSIASVPFAASVYSTHASTAWLNLHLVTTVGLWVFGELRRQCWNRRQVQRDLTELVAAAERR